MKENRRYPGIAAVFCGQIALVRMVKFEKFTKNLETLHFRLV